MKEINLKRRNKKRRETKGVFFVALLFFVLFPYILSGFSDIEKQKVSLEEQPGQIWVLEKKIWGTKKIPLEEYLIGMVAATIPPEYHIETLKAQTIILRSICISYMEKEGGKKVISDDSLKEYYFPKQSYGKLWGAQESVYLEKIQQAVDETQGTIIVWDDNIINPPFCRMTNGNTRDIGDYVIHKEKYGYMKTVECVEDKVAKEAVQYTEITQRDFKKVMKEFLGVQEKSLNKIILYKDSFDYVKVVKIGEKRINGEDFRNALGLISSCYSLEKINNSIEIKTKGMGHGYGFSQYTANQLAHKGKNYKELLEYFFANISIEKIS